MSTDARIIISLHFICYRIIFFSLYAPIKTEPKNRPGVKAVSEDPGVQKGIGTFFKCEWQVLSNWEGNIFKNEGEIKTVFNERKSFW